MIYIKKNQSYEWTYNKGLTTLFQKDNEVVLDPKIAYETSAIFEFDYLSDAIEIDEDTFITTYDYNKYMLNSEERVKENLNYFTRHFLQNMQLQSMIIRLNKNKYSKQAIMSLPKDIRNHYPAEMYVGFRILNNQLNIVSHMRANNAYGDTLINMHINAAIANKIIKILGISKVHYTHIVDEYHIYHKDISSVEKYLTCHE